MIVLESKQQVGGNYIVSLRKQSVPVPNFGRLEDLVVFARTESGTHTLEARVKSGDIMEVVVIFH